MRTAGSESPPIARPYADADPLAKARQLAPMIEAGTTGNEQNRELTPEVVSALHEAGLFKLLAPRAIGGMALDPDRFVAVVETVAAADASTAWCLNQTSVCSIAAAFMSADTARKIFSGSQALLAWGAGGKAQAVEVDGGYRVSGSWPFASGSRHATWMGGHCTVIAADGVPRIGRNGKPQERTMLFPRDSATFDDVWRVVGLKGTGSDTYCVTDLFVPEARSCPSIVDWIESTPSEPAVLFRFSGSGLYAAGFGGIALGNARGMLDAFIHLARDKTPRGARNALRDSPVVQMQVAQWDTQLRAARAFLLGSLQEIQADVARSGRMSVDHRMTLRVAGTYAIHQATDILEKVYRAAGATAIFEGNPFERRFRDGYAISQHLQGRLAHFELVGKHLLGMDTDLQFV